MSAGSDEEEEEEEEEKEEEEEEELLEERCCCFWPLAKSSHPLMPRGFPSRTTIPTTDSATTAPLGARSLQSGSMRPASLIFCTSSGSATATTSPGKPSQIALACVPLPPKLRRQRTEIPVSRSYFSEKAWVILA